MTNKKEVKDINEAKKILERIIKTEKLTNFPIVENTIISNKTKPPK